MINMVINSHYTLVTGFFKYNPKQIDTKSIDEKYCNWSANKKNNYEGLLKHLNNGYYDTYLKNMYPSNKVYPNNKEILSHLTLKECLEQEIVLKLIKEDISFTVEYIDLYLFPFGIGIFSIKIKIENIKVDINKFSSLLRSIRYYDTKILYRNKEIALLDFINIKVVKCINLAVDWTKYCPQLKLYSQIDIKDNFSQKEFTELLFDLGNIIPIGSAKGNGVFAPSKHYYQKQLEEHKISIFSNWTALALFDTFTRISIDFDDKYKSWEFEYFHIYIHCLFIKSFMYVTNSELNDLNHLPNKSQIIKDKFIYFINLYNLSHISYRFLPNLVFQTILNSFDVDNEIDRMELKIKRINETYQHRRDKRLNFILSLLAIFSVFSLNWDISQWLNELGISKDALYPTISLSIFSLIIITLFLILILKKR